MNNATNSEVMDFAAFTLALKAVSLVGCKLDKFNYEAPDNLLHICKYYINSWKFDRYIRNTQDNHIYPQIEAYHVIANKDKPLIEDSDKKQIVTFLQERINEYYGIHLKTSFVSMFGSYFYSLPTYNPSEIDILIRVNNSDIFHDGFYLSCKKSIISEIFGRNIEMLGIILVSENIFNSPIVSSELETTLLIDLGTSVPLFGLRKNQLSTSPYCNHLYDTKRLLAQSLTFDDELKKNFRLFEVVNRLVWCASKLNLPIDINLLDRYKQFYLEGEQISCIKMIERVYTEVYKILSVFELFLRKEAINLLYI